MGILNLSLVEERSKMKFFVAACLVAAAFAEPEAKADADAALLYGAYPYSYGHYLGKRSADAEPEAKADADPALLYGAYGYAGYPYAGLRTYGAYPYAAAYGAYPY